MGGAQGNTNYAALQSQAQSMAPGVAQMVNQFAPQTAMAQKGPSMLPPNLAGGGGMPTGAMAGQRGNMPPGPLPPTGTYAPNGNYGGINGPQNPQALNDMYTNHPVLYALRQRLMAEGKLPPPQQSQGLLGG